MGSPVHLLRGEWSSDPPAPKRLQVNSRMFTSELIRERVGSFRAGGILHSEGPVMGSRSMYWKTVLSDDSESSEQPSTSSTVTGQLIPEIHPLFQVSPGFESPTLMRRHSMEEFDSGEAHRKYLKRNEMPSIASRGAAHEVSATVAGNAAPPARDIDPVASLSPALRQQCLDSEVSLVRFRVSDERFASSTSWPTGGRALGGFRRTQVGEERRPAGAASRKFCCTIPLCGRRFERRGHLEEHMDSKHNNIQRFRCDECDRMFSHKSSWRRHVVNMHEADLTKKRRRLR